MTYCKNECCLFVRYGFKYTTGPIFARFFFFASYWNHDYVTSRNSTPDEYFGPDTT